MLKELINLANHYDFYYMYSDSAYEYNSGQKERNRIIEKYKLLSLEDQEVFKTFWKNKFKKEFNE